MNIHLITQDNTPYTINNKQFVGGNRINWFLNITCSFALLMNSLHVQKHPKKKTLEMQKE